MKKGWFRCSNCGRLMSYADLDEGRCSFTPDTDFTSECIEDSHRDCKNTKKGIGRSYYPSEPPAEDMPEGEE